MLIYRVLKLRELFVLKTNGGKAGALHKHSSQGKEIDKNRRKSGRAKPLLERKKVGGRQASPPPVL